MNGNFEYGGKTSESVNTYSKYYNDNYEKNGSPKGYNLENILNDPQNHIKDIFYLSKYYYNKVGIIMRVINIIRDFGIEKYKLNYKSNNKKVRKVIDKFIERINLPSVLKDILFELALTGNCAGYNRNGNRIDIYPITKIEVSPLIVNNKPVLYYLNDFGFDYDLNLSDNKILDKLDLSYPKEIALGIKQGNDKIMLDVNNTFFLKTNSSRYEAYGVPFILPAFDNLSHKTVLLQAERATATGIIDKILKISVGDKDHSPKQQEIEFYDGLINNKKGALKVTVPYFVNMEWIEPKTDIFGRSKFEQVDLDILDALGVSLTLIRGQGGGNYSEAFISIAGLIKTIENLRAEIPYLVKDWFKSELIKNNLNPEYAPDFELSKVEIDKSIKLEMIKWLFQNAGLPYEVLYEESGYDYASVKLIRDNENKENIDEVFTLHDQPFQGNQNNEGGRPKKDMIDRKTDKKQSNNNTPRPSTSNL